TLCCKDDYFICNLRQPEKVIIAHMPDDRMVVSYGSGYGGNSLLGKKCFALRIAGRIAYDEGWMAEHMLIMSVTNPKGVEKFFVAAFPSACGKTNLAMIQPTLPGYTVRCVGDDIAWMRFNKDGQLMAINPENGFFGVAPGTNHQTNPNAMAALQRDCILTNGLEDEVDKDIPITTWLGKPYKIGSKENYPSSHPNSRFTAPAKNCPIMHPKWEDPAGVPISGIIFGGRRPEGVPLVIEAEDWKHGVFLGAQVKSEATAAAEFKGKQIMHDPMAMRPFLGYNFGKYLQHWLDMEKPGRKMPKIFHVNWLWREHPRSGLDDARRVDGEDIAEPTAVGLVPKEGSINTDGLNINWKELFSIPPDYWKGDIHETRRYLEEQVGDDIPPVLRSELDRVEARVDAMK
uniref:phosphoenolpyruvate carboxykinase (GTP) n=1 Tax=Macrostomum lignano TaxID=282301 RepID=A0A1I8HRB4_9PLAT